ncbi:predicted protein [Methanosarcina acetivorans C2A]|uniref:Uncharacterized protein n=1 Tax=Methanosarcina acetivorans (strain ATCC 35395 / DSM 2834 / JCM 12185 / C2A) TaxID=188937 RepID=Q8TP85_METAC|nr:predicted protein [Methanosarcina acetivorans C2A]
MSFLASRFTWKVIYPVFLIGLGYFRFIVKSEDTLFSQAVNPRPRKEFLETSFLSIPGTLPACRTIKLLCL